MTIAEIVSNLDRLNFILSIAQGTTTPIEIRIAELELELERRKAMLS